MKFKAQKFYEMTFLMWLIIVVGHAFVHLIDIFNLPPSKDLYANSIEFQIISYTLTILPIWIIILIIILFIEFFIFRKNK